MTNNHGRQVLQIMPPTNRPPVATYAVTGSSSEWYLLQGLFTSHPLNQYASLVQPPASYSTDTSMARLTHQIMELHGSLDALLVSGSNRRFIEAIELIKAVRETEKAGHAGRQIGIVAMCRVASDEEARLRAQFLFNRLSDTPAINAYISSTDDPERTNELAYGLVNALELTRDGGIYSPVPLTPVDKEGILTPREFEICGLMGKGIRESEIESRLGISLRTLEVHFTHIMKKLGLHKREDIRNLG